MIDDRHVEKSKQGICSLAIITDQLHQWTTGGLYAADEAQNSSGCSSGTTVQQRLHRQL